MKYNREDSITQRGGAKQSLLISTPFQLYQQSRNVIFLGAKRIILDQRGSLRNEIIELLECLKSWFRLSIFTKEDLHAIFSSMEELEEEAFERAMDY